MDRLARVVAAVVRGLAGLLTDDRRDYPHALLAEAREVPAGSARLAWLAGGLWLVVREVVIPPNLRHEYDVEGNVAHAGGSTLLALLIVPLVGGAIAAGRNPLPSSPSGRARQSSRTS